MNSRERVELALNHKEADYIPSDLGGSSMTGISLAAYRNLRQYLRLPDVNVRVFNLIQQLAAVDQDVRDQFKVDVIGVKPNPSTVDATVQIKDDMPNYTYFYNEWGIGWKKPKDGGLYYDIFHSPLQGDISVADIERYPWPNPTDPARFVGVRERVWQAAKVEQKAVLVGSLSAGFVEMASWLRGFENYLADLIVNPELVEALSDKLLELQMAYWGRMLEECGEYITAIVFSDDLGSQRDLLFSPKAYRTLVKPRHKALFAFIKARSSAKIFFHCCGAIRKIIPDLIDAGVDILNPVQVSAVGMDTAALKREFGQDLTFWGGGIDTQHVLGTKSIPEIKNGVRRRIDDLAAGGGFVFATVHSIQANVPPENIAAVWETLHEYGIYDRQTA